MHNQSNVRLPEWIWETAQNERELKRLILEYIKPRYPGYEVQQVRGRIAICQIPHQ